MIRVRVTVHYYCPRRTVWVRVIDERMGYTKGRQCFVCLDAVCICIDVIGISVRADVSDG